MIIIITLARACFFEDCFVAPFSRSKQTHLLLLIDRIREGGGVKVTQNMILPCIRVVMYVQYMNGHRNTVFSASV